MKINGKDACDWCGKVFRTKYYIKYTDGSCYHHACVKKVGGPQDLGYHPARLKKVSGLGLGKKRSKK